MPCARAPAAAVVGCMHRGFNRLLGFGLGLGGLLAQLVEGLQVGLAHAVDKTGKR